jgi:hypothetical protein
VAHAPNCSGDKDQEDYCLKPAWANSSRDPVLKNPITKKGLMEWLRCRFRVQTPIKTKKKKRA